MEETIDKGRIVARIQDYGKRTMELGFYDKGTPEYSKSFKNMIIAFGDILCLLEGKEPPDVSAWLEDGNA